MLTNLLKTCCASLAHNIKIGVQKTWIPNKLPLYCTLIYLNVFALKACISSSDGKEIFDIYKDKPKKVPLGDVIGVSGSKFPSYILCKNGQLMKLRRQRKVLKTPYFVPETQEFKNSMVLLYFPLKPNNDINLERLGKNML